MTGSSSISACLQTTNSTREKRVTATCCNEFGRCDTLSVLGKDVQRAGLQALAGLKIERRCPKLPKLLATHRPQCSHRVTRTPQSFGIRRRPATTACPPHHAIADAVFICRRQTNGCNVYMVCRIAVGSPASAGPYQEKRGTQRTIPGDAKPSRSERSSATVTLALRLPG